MKEPTFNWLLDAYKCVYTGVIMEIIDIEYDGDFDDLKRGKATLSPNTNVSLRKLGSVTLGGHKCYDYYDAKASELSPVVDIHDLCKEELRTLYAETKRHFSSVFVSCSNSLGIEEEQQHYYFDSYLAYCDEEEIEDTEDEFLSYMLYH